VFDHTQFGNPDGTFGDNTFGMVAGARAARIVQAALKFLFKQGVEVSAGAQSKFIANLHSKIGVARGSRFSRERGR
jgi:hypothetical protein